MSIEIDWFAFVQVFAAALVGALLVVGFYAVGLRLLVRAGRAPSSHRRSSPTRSP